MMKNLFYNKNLTVVLAFSFLLLIDFYRLYLRIFTPRSLIEITISTLVSLYILTDNKRTIKGYVGYIKTKSKKRLQEMWDSVLTYSLIFFLSILFQFFEINLVTVVSSFAMTIAYFLVIQQAISINNFISDEIRNEFKQI